MGMLERNGATWKEAEGWRLRELPLRRDNQAVQLDADIEDLLQLALQQNFVPVVDAHNIFIGIVTRKDIIQYFSVQAFTEAQSTQQQSDFECLLPSAILANYLMQSSDSYRGKLQEAERKRKRLLMMSSE